MVDILAATSTQLDLTQLDSSDFAVAESKPFAPPLVQKVLFTAGGLEFVPGFYIMYGRTGVGKTTTALALGLAINAAAGVPSATPSFQSIGEPRSSSPLDSKLFSGDAVPVARALLAIAVNGPKRGVPRYVIADSVTHILPAIGAIVLNKADDVTMKDGLRRSEVLGVLSLDSACSRLGVCVIGTVNADLFPRSQALEGACEGAIELAIGGMATKRDRIDRVARAIDLSRTLPQAASLLGYHSQVRSDSPFKTSL